MKRLSVILLFFAGINASGQKQTFDIITYTPPNQWNKENSESAVQLTKQDEAKGIYCIITLMKSIPGTENSKENFDAAWETVVKEMVKVSAAPEMQPVTKEDGWEAQSGYAPFESEGAKGIAFLVSSSGYQKMVNILILTNTDVYEKEMTAFLESISFTKPANTSSKITNAETNTQPDPNQAENGGFTYYTTNFDNGWTSKIYDDYVLTSKGNIKVYLSYSEKINESDYSGTGREKRHHYWDTYVSKYFVTGEKKFDKGGALSEFSPDFIEGWATDKQTGEKRYIGMIINIFAYTGRLSIIIASAPDEHQFRRQFPKADARFDNDLLNMYSYNKFAVGKNDLAGKWSSSGGGTMSWYSTTTGENVGATGVVTGDEFHFINSSSYTSSHSGATGRVGSMNTYQQKYKGSYAVTDWSVTVTNRWDGKTEKYDASFEILRGGRVLHLKSTGLTYALGKVN